MKSFQEMTRADYEAIGLKAGLEIHQQLLTDLKLFCRCPAGNYSQKYDAEILRHMRPTLSELGEYDGTALMEFKTKKEIIYQINHETVCTYEMDDTPPFEINQYALNIALQIAMLLNYKLVSEIHIARKQYLDGSIPTGFQRTTIVGVDGSIPFKDRSIGLVQLGLEEDACREVSDFGHLRTYLTDRLGMPLIEVVTRPEMKTPQEVAEVADLIRRLVRSTGRVRKGLGAARQDVNVSIRGGTRVEIKGVHRIPLIPLLIYNEAKRQYNLLQIQDELHRRGITENTFHYESSEITSLLVETVWDPILHALKRNEEIHCVILKGYAGLLKHPTQTDKVFSREISDRVRVVACLSRLPNIITSDSTEETIDSFIWKKIRRSVNAGSRDALVLVWGNHTDVRTAVQEIAIRAREATICIPNETRQALADGTNGFERILPGPDRMYPDTDLPPLEITEKRIEELEKDVPEPVWEREKKYRQLGLPEHLVYKIAASPSAPLFEELCNKYHLSPIQVAVLLFEKTTAWRRAGLPTDKLTNNEWKTFLKQVEKAPAVLEAADFIFIEYLQGKALHIEDAIKHYNPPQKISDLKNIFSELLDSEQDWPKISDKVFRYFMGKMMQKCRGKILGNKVAKFLKSELKNIPVKQNESMK
jgi:glutamyl-tRNA(Gln) amidotransferase subunit E